jgi:hypothetical protein
MAGVLSDTKEGADTGALVGTSVVWVSSLTAAGLLLYTTPISPVLIAAGAAPYLGVTYLVSKPGSWLGRGVGALGGATVGAVRAVSSSIKETEMAELGPESSNQLLLQQQHESSGKKSNDDEVIELTPASPTPNRV